MKRIGLLSCVTAAVLLLSSCATEHQFYGATTGAAVGGLFGSAIGGIAGGPRGHDAGGLAGMLIGGAVGAAATAPKTQDGYYEGYRGEPMGPFDGLEVSNIRFWDDDDSHMLEAGENAKLSFEIKNVSRDYIYDIAPVVKVKGTKQIYISPTAIISELEPGGAVRYQAELIASDKLKNGNVEFTIGFSDRGRMYPVRSFQLRTVGR